MTSLPQHQKAPDFSRGMNGLLGLSVRGFASDTRKKPRARGCGGSPSITIQTGTFNSDLSLFKQVLESVKMQNYPKGRIEHLVFDKGSTNGAVALAKRYGCRVIHHVSAPERAQESAAMGILRAKGDLILVLESDNILTSKIWLRQMVQPFLEHEDVFCTFSAYNDYYPSMNLTTRYSALFGSPDPTLYYLHKTEKIRMDQKEYDKGVILAKRPTYNLVRFDKQTLPTLGDNGHMFKKDAMAKVIEDPASYTHTDAFANLLDLGYDTFGAVKNSLIHVMPPDIFELVRRRIRIKTLYYDRRRGRRAYLVYNPASAQDRWNLLKYIFLSLTVISPLFISLKGYRKIKDPAWFLHPIMCLLMVLGYGWSEFAFQMDRFRLHALKALRQL